MRMHCRNVAARPQYSHNGSAVAGIVKSFGDALPAGPSPRARCPKAIDARAGGHWQQFLTGEFLTDKRIKRYRGNKLPITTSNRESYNMNAVLGEIPNGHF